MISRQLVFFRYIFPFLLASICGTRLSYPIFSVNGRYFPEPFILILLLAAFSISNSFKSYFFKPKIPYALSAFLLVLFIFGCLLTSPSESYIEFRTSLAAILSYLIINAYHKSFKASLPSFFFIYGTSVAILTPLSRILFPNYEGLVSDQSLRLYTPFIAFYSSALFFFVENRFIPVLFFSLLSILAFFLTTFRTNIIAFFFILSLFASFFVLKAPLVRLTRLLKSLLKLFFYSKYSIFLFALLATFSYLLYAFIASMSKFTLNSYLFYLTRGLGSFYTFDNSISATLQEHATRSISPLTIFNSFHDFILPHGYGWRQSSDLLSNNIFLADSGLSYLIYVYGFLLVLIILSLFIYKNIPRKNLYAQAVFLNSVIFLGFATYSTADHFYTFISGFSLGTLLGVISILKDSQPAIFCSSANHTICRP
jgi:hypothetical protein